MKLVKINKPQVNEIKEVPGLVNCRIEYEVKTAKGRLAYSGPRFTPEMWHQVMSFFRWTHKEMQSESQVRLYVNLKEGRWGAWAFPQVARTGMSAREVPSPETPDKARARFASWHSEPSDDWLYFGTAHHHCSASAFQSSTDERNEWNQDGLHITVGRMDADRHDLHARFYLGGNCFEPGMSLFWPIEADLASKIPPGMHDELARFQMCEKITVDFPDVWRANLVEVERGRQPPDSTELWGPEQTEWGAPLEIRVEEALDEISGRCTSRGIREEQWLKTLESLSADDASRIIIDSCLAHGISPDEILAEMSQFTFGY